MAISEFLMFFSLSKLDPYSSTLYFPDYNSTQATMSHITLLGCTQILNKSEK